MADIESSVALDISDARGSIEDLGDLIRTEVGGAFDDVVADFQSAFTQIDFTGILTEGQAASELLGESFRAELQGSVETALSDGFAQGGLVGAAAILDTGQQALDELAAAAVEQLPDAFAQAGIIGGAALLDTGQQAIGELAQDARDELGGALTEAAKEFTSALDTGAPLESLDLSAATDQFEQLTVAAQDAGDQSEETAGDFSSVQGSGEALGNALQVAQGHTGGLTGQLTRAAGAAGPVVIGVTAAAGAATAFAAAGLTAVAAAERLDQVFGTFADDLDRINVGGLNGDLDDLAVKAGSTASPLRQVVANLGQFTVAEGLSQQESAGLAEKFSALTLRAIALNPRLGDAGEAGQRLFNALKSGRATALTPFALGIDAVGVKVKALELGLISSMDQSLTPFQRLMAGIQLATEKAGNSLGSDFDRGAQQAATRVKALKAALEESVEKLGTPLVEPLLAFGERLVPIAEQVGRLAAVILTAFVPVLEDLTPLLTALADTLEVVGNVLEVIAPLLSPVIAGFLAFKVASAVATSGATLLAGGIGRIGGTLAALRGQEVVAGGALTKIGTGIGKVAAAAPGIAVGLGIGISSMKQFGETTEGTVGTVGGFAVAGAALGSVIPGVGTALGAVGGVLAGVTVGLIAGGESVDDYRAKFTKLGSELDTFNRKQALQKFIDQLGDRDLLGLMVGDVKAVTDEVEALAKSSPAAAEKVVAGLKAMRDESGKPLFNKKEAELLDRAVRSGTKALKEANEEKTKADARNKELTSSSATAAEQIAKQAAAEKLAAEELLNMTEAAVGALPQVSAAFDEAVGAADRFGASVSSIANDGFAALQKAADTFGVAATPSNLQDALRHRLDAAARFQFDLLTIFVNGQRSLAEFLAEKGPEEAGGLAQQIAQSIRDGQPEVAGAIEGTLAEIRGIDEKLAGAITLDKFREKLFGQIVSTAVFADNLSAIVEAGFGAVAKKVSELGPEKGGEVAQQLADGIRRGEPEVAKQLEDLLSFKEAQGEKFGENFKNVLSGKIRDGAKAAKEEARTSMEEIPGVIGEIAPLAAVEATNLGEGVTSELAVGLDGVGRVTKRAVDSAIDEVKKGKPGGELAGKVSGEAVANAFGIGIEPMSGKARTAASGAGEEVRKGLDSAVQFAFFGGLSIGQSAAAGIAAGLTAADLAGAAQTATDNILGKVKEKLGITSPSKVFADEVGRPIGQGIALGIESEQGRIEQSLIDAVKPPAVARQGSVIDGATIARSRPALVADFPAPSSDGVRDVWNIEKVVLEQAPTNPTREVMRATRTLGRARAHAQLGP